MCFGLWIILVWIQANYKLSLSIFTWHSCCLLVYHGTSRKHIFKGHESGSERFCKIPTRTNFAAVPSSIKYVSFSFVFHGKSDCMCSNSCINFLHLEDWIAERGSVPSASRRKGHFTLQIPVKKIIIIFKISSMLSLTRNVFSFDFF